MSLASRSTRQAIYLGLAVLGFIAPGIPTVAESLASGNILFWTKPHLTLAGLFANLTSTAFALDLFCAVIVFLVWAFIEARRLGMRGPWKYVLLVLVFGLGPSFPIFLRARERRMGELEGAAA